MHRYSLQTLTLASSIGLLGPTVAAQQRVVFQGAIVQPTALTDSDGGREVEMFESPNLDRFLRRARQFLEEEKYQEAIQLLQAVVEGRTLEAAPEAGTGNGDGSGAGTGGGNGSDGDPGRASGSGSGRDATARAHRGPVDPAQSVFSADGRVYRPARRLCHEYLANMPEVGIELYRSLYESRAADMLRAAQDSGLVSDLERVGNSYFPTLAAGRALQSLADRHMHEGQYRAAVQVLRDLVDLYPAVNRRALGISPLWCGFKIALCLRLAGEVGAAVEAAAGLAAAFPDESLRIMGELQPVRDLPGLPLFRADDPELIDTARPGATAPSWLAAGPSELVPLWQYRFAGPNPYERIAPQNARGNVFFGGDVAVPRCAPPADKYGTGTQIHFRGDGTTADRALFLENYRLRVADGYSGIVRVAGDGPPEPGRAQEMKPRARVPVYDLTLLTPVEDAQRYYVVLGHNRIDQSVDALKLNELVAYRKGDCERLWSSASFGAGDDGLEDVTFLAAPTVFGERLLAPVLVGEAYALQCLDRGTGRPLWRTRIHAGGTAYFKAPGARVAVSGNLAFVLTNAGAVAAVDGFAGDLRWIRKYERSDPLREKPVGRRVQADGMFVNAYAFVERDLQTFLPSELMVVGGTIIFAGCDSEMLLCLDGASGDPVWMVDGTTRYAPYGRMRYLIGRDDQSLFVATDSDVVCIDAGSGLIRWSRELPALTERMQRWRGRGCVVDGRLLMPGDREVQVLATDGRGPWQRLDLPAFGLGDEPLRGAANLSCSGPWLGIAYAGGVEVYSTVAALRGLADREADPVRRSTLLVQAGDERGALAALTGWLREHDVPPESRRPIEEQLVAVARDLALADGGEGLACLDRVREFVTDRTARENWHLARLDYRRHSGDRAGYETEQQALYRFMEGKD